MRIGVYCSVASALPEKWIADARTFGVWIGKHGIELVYGGVNAGLMATIADAAKSAGSKIVGVVPVRRFDCEWPHNDIRIPAADLCERKNTILMLSDAFVVFPGGYGTLDELISTFAHLNFTEQHKPLIVYNADGIFDPFMQQLNLFVEYGLMKAEALGLLQTVRTVDELTETLEAIQKKGKK